MNKMAMKVMIVAIKDAKNAQPYPETGETPPIFPTLSRTAPIKGRKTAPPKKGKRLPVPIDVPAIAVGKSSLVTVKAITTMLPEKTPMRKQMRARIVAFSRAVKNARGIQTVMRIIDAHGDHHEDIGRFGFVQTVNLHHEGAAPETSETEQGPAGEEEPEGEGSEVRLAKNDSHSPQKPDPVFPRNSFGFRGIHFHERG
jgi:hypothetical protein